MSYYFNCNQTGFCQTNEVIWKIGNLTASYTDNNGGELMMVSAPVIMLILAALYSAGVLDASAVLGPKYRLFLSSALALFLPVMSYLFSEAKDHGAGEPASSDLSVRAGMILTWMLLVELLRKKVDEIHVRDSYYWSTIQRAGWVVWLGSLVYFNIRSPGRKAMFSILWILCATKLLQRIVFTEVEKRSYPDKSWLISSYMAEMLKIERYARGTSSLDGNGSHLLRRCKYIVVGEEKLVGKVTADGYRLNMNTDGDASIITVGKVWQLVSDHDQIFTVFDRNESIRRVCLSFALFKLLRRRFEHLPELTDEEARDCRHLLTRGLQHNDDGDTVEAETLFQVMADEVKFLTEYYHSAVPVVLASPLFVLVNYFLVPIAVLAFCLAAVLLCGNGDVGYVLSRMSADNYALLPGFAKLGICALARASQSRAAFFFILDLAITVLLFIIFFLEEIWESLAVVISNWFVISMLCNYVAKPHWRANRRTISRAFSCILRLRRKMRKYTNIRLKQFSLLDYRGPVMQFLPATVLYLKLRSVPATGRLKRSTMNCLVDHHGRRDATPLPNGESALRGHNLHDELSWACSSSSVTEVILTWHIATCLLHAGLPASSEEEADTQKVAVSLSNYCAYLVVFHPELLPDRRAKAELVFEDTITELREMLGFWGYYLSSQRARINRLIAQIRKADDYPMRFEEQNEADENKVVMKGVKLGMVLLDRRYSVAWKVLADVWTELMVYAVPSSDEEHVNAHAGILPEGVELITVLWAFATHTGISRPRRRESDDVRLQPC